MSSPLVTEVDLPQNLRSLVQKADAAIQSQNVGYAVQLLLPVVKAEPAFLDGRRIIIERRAPLDDSIIAISGLADHHFGWRQFRAMGASALDISAVASGSFDGFVDMSPDAHGVWDYLGALLVVGEAGGAVADAFGRDLIVLDPAARRTPIAASSSALLECLRVRRVSDRIAGVGDQGINRP